MRVVNRAELRQKRHRRVRARIAGTAKIPRLSVFRSHKHISAQLIDDEKGVTLVSAGDLELKSQKQDKAGQDKSPKLNTAFRVGQLIAGKALEKKFKKIVFDRGGYKYWGRVKSLADGAREGGLEF